MSVFVLIFFAPAYAETFSSSSPTIDGFAHRSGTSSSSECGPTYGNSTTGATLDLRFSTAYGGGADCAVIFIEWDISSIPEGSTIDNVTLKFDVLDTLTGVRNCDYRAIENRPVTAGSAQDLWDDVMDGDLYATNDAACASVGDNKVVVLNSNATADMESQLSSGWFAVGIAAVNFNCGSSGSVCRTRLVSSEGTGTPDPTLEITYTPPEEDVTVCSSGCHATTIQGGINMASSGDTVTIMDSRFYKEALVVNKSISLTSIAGAVPTVFTDVNLSTVNITSDDVSVSRLVIKYNMTGTRSAVNITSSRTNITIHNNTIEAVGRISPGIYSGGGLTYSTISNNIIKTGGSLNQNHGIILAIGGNNYNNIIHNVIRTSGTSVNRGIDISGDHNNISYNDVRTNATSISAGSGSSGILILEGSFNSVSNNFVIADGFSGASRSGSNDGISLDDGTSFNYVFNNTITAMGGTTTAARSNGIDVRSISAVIESNSISVPSPSRGYGIRFNFEADNTTVVNNVINSASYEDVYDDVTSSQLSDPVNYVVNSSFSEIGFESDSKGDVLVQHAVDVRVVHANGSAVQSATVVIADSQSVHDSYNPTSSISLTTNGTGHIPQKFLSEYRINRTQTAIYFNNYTFTASKGGFAGNSTSWNVTDNVALQIMLLPVTYRTPVGGPFASSWSAPVAGGLVRSGTPYSWTWEVWTSGSGRKTPQGTPYFWTWGSE